MRKRRPDEYNPIAPPRALAVEWEKKLAAAGVRNIEYEDGSILGLSMQNINRAPSADEAAAGREAASRDAEFFYATDWRGRGRHKSLWHGYINSTPMRTLAGAYGIPLTTVHRTLEKLRGEAEAWWVATEGQRHNPNPVAGRPRAEEPRTLRVTVRLSRAEHRVIQAAITRAGKKAKHERVAWMRWALIACAQEQREVPRKRDDSK